MNQENGKETRNLPPGHPGQVLAKGHEALALGRTGEAAECVRYVLTANPNLVEGHLLAGLVARRMRDRGTAIRAFSTVTRLQPDHPEAYAHLAQIYMMAGLPDRGFKALGRAVANEAGRPEVQNLIGNVFFRLGDQAAANQWYSKAVAGQPSNPAFAVDHANSLVFIGRREQAEAEVRKVLRLQPRNPQAHWILSTITRTENDEHISAMRKLASQAGLHPHNAAFFHYAMGKELEDLQRWDEAFEAFSRGAEAKRKLVDFDEDAECEMFRTLEEVFTPEWLMRQPAGLDDPSPIFIVGQPRTGTTLVERVISSHSQVRSAGELRHFSIAVRRLADYRGPEQFSADLARRAARLNGRELGRAYFDASEIMRGDSPRFIDKMPTNYLYIPLILLSFPNARIIHLVREPMDACFSSFKQLFADAYLHSYDQREMARHHLRYLRLMSAWRQRFPGRFLDVAYEDFARDIEPNARAVIEYLGLEWEESCLRFHEQASAVATASAVQVREPAHTRSIGRWKNYRDQLGPMRDEFTRAGMFQ